MISCRALSDVTVTSLQVPVGHSDSEQIHVVTIGCRSICRIHSLWHTHDAVRTLSWSFRWVITI